MESDPLKNKHSVFNIPRTEIVALIDEAWGLKGPPLTNDPFAYVVDMKRIIGTDGETAIRIIIKKQGSAELRTAYPIKLDGGI